MKSYQVYAVGTAIVDYQFTLFAEYPFKLEKGTTTLIDSETEKSLFQKLAKYPLTKICGGTSANTLSVISGMGGNVFHSCKVADDEAGHFYHEDLRNHNIESNLDYVSKASGDTGKCLIVVSDDAERTLYSQTGANQHLSHTDLNESALQNSQYLFVETFLATAPTSKATVISAIKLAKKFNCKIALTLSTCKIPGFKTENLYDFTNHGIDLLFCNELEAAYFCETNNLSDIKEKLKTFAKQFVITRGAKETIIFDGNDFFEIATYPTTAVNTTGAGDAFAGAFLYAITSGYDFKKAADLGNFAASKIISKFSNRLTQQDLELITHHLERV